MEEKPIRKYTKSAVVVDRQYKMSDEKREYIREYMRERYRLDAEFRKDAINRTKHTRDRKNAKNTIETLEAILLKKIEKGPLHERFGEYIPKRRGRPRQIDENGNRFFVHHKK
jgi:hypothetical protein